MIERAVEETARAGDVMRRGVTAHNGHNNATGVKDAQPEIRIDVPIIAMAPPLQRQPPVSEAIDAPLDRATPRWLSRYSASLVVLDFGLAFLASALAFPFSNSQNSVTYLVMTLAFPAMFVCCLLLQRAYEPRFLGTGTDEYRRVFDAGIRFVAVTLAIAFAFRFEHDRSYVLVAMPLAIALVLAGRYEARRVLWRRRAHGHCMHRVVVVGRERSVAELVRHISRDTTSGFSVVAACLDVPGPSDVEGVPVIGDTNSVIDALRAVDADTLAVTAWSDLSQAGLRRLSWQLEGSGIAILVAPRLADVAGPRIHVRPVARLPLLHVEEPEFRGGRRFAKALIDRIGGLILLTVLLPVLAVVAIVVRLSSRGPALFRQQRVGVAGKNFTLYKFRTMVLDAEQRLESLQRLNDNADGLLFKVRADPRVTPVGRFLRRYSVDELPQLINVVRGEMSLVGPRPPLPREVAGYHRDVHRRLLVKPGMTGMWQVSGRSDLSWEESVRLDLDYVENWSLMTDMAILWRTVSAVTRRRGAY